MTIEMEINTVLNILAVLIIAIIGFFLRRHFADYDKSKVEAKEEAALVKKEMTEIKDNYLNRFAAISREVAEVKSQVVDRIHETEKILLKAINDK